MRRSETLHWLECDLCHDQSTPMPDEHSADRMARSEGFHNASGLHLCESCLAKVQPVRVEEPSGV